MYWMHTDLEDSCYNKSTNCFVFYLLSFLWKLRMILQRSWLIHVSLFSSYTFLDGVNMIMHKHPLFEYKGWKHSFILRDRHIEPCSLSRASLGCNKGTVRLQETGLWRNSSLLCCSKKRPGAIETFCRVWSKCWHSKQGWGNHFAPCLLRRNGCLC